MKNYKNYLRALTVVLSLLFAQTASFAQTCGDGTCDAAAFENNISCPGDCPPVTCNGDGICDDGEDAFNCPNDNCTIDLGLSPPIKPSGGDDPCVATPIKTGLACIQYSNDTSTATTNPGTPACWASVTKDVWFTFVATSEDMTVSTDAVIFEVFPGQANNDTELALYSGACASLTELDCNQDEGINSGIDLAQGKSSPTRQALVERTGLTVGETYYLRVQGVTGTVDVDGIGNFCVSAFDTYTVGSRSCEAQAVHPNNSAGTCDYNNGNAVKNKISTGAYDPATTMQPNAYVPLGETYSCAPQITASMYGGWVKWTAEDASDVTVENISGGGRDYTLFDATICVNLNCIDSRTGIAAGGTTTFTGIVAGTKYYLLTTLSSGATTDGFVTDVCLKSSTPPVNPEIEKNEGGVAGAGGSAQSDNCPAFEIFVDQVYEGTTYAADADGPSKCNKGKNIWVTWKVPSDYPTENGVQEAFFQMWSKNCTGGPGSPGTRLIVGAGILGDPCMGDNCLEFSSPSQNPQVGDGSSGDTDIYTDGATNVGWDPSKYGNQYWGIFQSGNDGSGEEQCTFNFMIGSTPSLKGITIPDATICLGESVTLTAEGATAYEWFDGSTGDSHTDTPTTNSSYTVYATAGAEGYAVGYVTVITPPVVSVNSGGICSGATSLELTASGAEQYDWSPATDLDVVTGATVNANPPATTVYTVTGVNGRKTGTYDGRFDFAGCSATADATVTVGGSIPIQVNDGVVCSGESTTLTASGADTYTWNPTTDLTNMNADSAVASPTAPITYTVTGESNGCFGEAVANVTMSPAPTITVNDATVCAGQTATLTAGGGVTYLWEDGSTGGTFTTPPIAATTTFSVTGTDASGCTGTVVSTVTLGPGLSTVSVDPITTCAGLNVTLNALGADTYVWSDASTGSSLSLTNVTAADSYTVTGTVTATGCTGEAVGTITIAAGLTITVNDGSFCAGGSAVLTASGGTTYDWLPDDGSLDAITGTSVTASSAGATTYTVTGNTNGCIGTATATVSITGLDDAEFAYSGATFCAPSSDTPVRNTAETNPSVYTISPAGLTIDASTGAIDVPVGSTVSNYIVTLTTDDGCPNTYTVSLDVVGNPDATFSYAGPYCEGDATTSATITQPAGSTPGNFTADVEGAGGIVFVSSTSGEIDLVNSAPGNYVVTNTIPAGNGCPATDENTTVTINPTPVILSSSDTKCAGELGTLTATGGAGAATFSWSDGTSVAALTATPTVTTTYTVTGTENGCASVPVEGTITINPIPTVTVSDGAVCDGSAATVTASGADSYTWAGGGTPSGDALTDTPSATTTYTVTGTTNGCPADAVATITLNTSPAVTVSPDVTICTGSTGAALTANGATTYSWSNGETTPGINVNPATTTTYTVTGTTAGCEGTEIVVVSVVTTPTPTIPTPEDVCLGNAVSATAVGGDTYVWSDGTVGATLNVTPTASGPYTVTATTNGCSGTESVTITINPIPVVVTTSTVVCVGASATITAVGGTGAATFAWSNGATGTSYTDANATAASTFSVTALENGCSSIPVEVTIAVTEPPVVTTSDTIVCEGQSTTLTALGTGNGVLTYSWLPGGAISNTINVTPTGLTPYTVTVTDAAGCTGSAIATVAVTPAPRAAFDDPATMYLSEADILFQDRSTNATTWLWDFGDTVSSSLQNPQHIYADTGTFVITLKVTGGSCPDSVSHDITIIPDVIVFIPNAFSPNGDGINDGFSFKGEGIDTDGFKFYVFDRWGAQMFFSTDVNDLWMGDYQGEACPVDVYVYVVVIEDGFGKEKRYLGQVSLVR